MSGVKHDQGKVRLGLLPTEALMEIGKVLTFGAGKYGPWNWKEGMVWSRLIDALDRHVCAWKERADGDPETGLSHLAHAGCCLLFLLTYEVLGLGEDDRWRAPSPPNSDDVRRPAV